MAVQSGTTLHRLREHKSDFQNSKIYPISSEPNVLKFAIDARASLVVMVANPAPPQGIATAAYLCDKVLSVYRNIAASLLLRLSRI